MNHFQRKLFNHLKENFDINEEIDFFDEGHPEMIEIETETMFCEINLMVYAKMDQEIGGEDDEILFVMKNKSIEVQIINLYHIHIGDKEDEQITISQDFKNKVERLLNDQINEE